MPGIFLVQPVGPSKKGSQPKKKTSGGSRKKFHPGDLNKLGPSKKIKHSVPLLGRSTSGRVDHQSNSMLTKHTRNEWKYVAAH